MQVIASSSTRRRRAEIQAYVTFDSNDQGTLTEINTSASIFYISGDLLGTNNEVVGSQSSSKDSPLIRASNPPAGFKFWSFPSGVGHVEGAGGFCLLGSEVYIVIDQSTCELPINLEQHGMFSETFFFGGQMRLQGSFQIPQQ